MGALTRLITALFLGGCAAMIYFGEDRQPHRNADLVEPPRAAIMVTTLAAPDQKAPLTMLYVVQTQTALRAHPSPNAPLVETLTVGSPAVVIKDTGAGWLQVHVTDSGAQGFVADAALSLEMPG